MESELEVFLIRNYATIHRLSERKDELDAPVLSRLTKAFGEIVREKTKGHGYNWALDPDYEMYVYHRESWSLPIQEDDEGLRSVQFSGGELDDESTDSGFADLFGVSGRSVYALAWATPLSRLLDDLNEARALWDEYVGADLERRGWEPFGRRKKALSAYWGHRIRVSVRPEQLADALEAGDLRPALHAYERAFDDFLAVADKIDRVVEIALERKHSRVPATV